MKSIFSEKIDHLRFDIFELTEKNMTEPFVETPEGFLRGRAIVANTGIQSYVLSDGTVLRELRTKDEVGKIESLNSYKNIVITSGHPEGEVNSKNAKILAVGFTGSDVRFDGHAVSIDLVITDKDTIDNIKKYGKTAVSAGYYANVIKESGQAFGNMDYNSVQTNIRANHIAVNLDRGRAGDLARLRLRKDTLDGIFCDNFNLSKSEVKMSKILLNDIEFFEVEQRIADEFNKLVAIKKDFDDLKVKNAQREKDFSILLADRDTLKDKHQKLLEENDKLKKETLNDEQIKSAVRERLLLVDCAVKNNVEITDSIDNTEIKKRIILKAFPLANFENKNDDYINARFDSAIELLNLQKLNTDKSKTLTKKNDGCGKEQDYEKKQKKELKNLYKLNDSERILFSKGIINDEMKKKLEEN